MGISIEEHRSRAVRCVTNLELAFEDVPQLIDTTADLHLWAERYDRNLEDVFAVQAEVALSVATARWPLR